ncbi:16S rRNA (cytosine(967)-C(5))-methyltransferase RsmB [Macrococcus armenti]|uniref:16S rRNA (cytosine(967)-C(5))-methyltransferase RsmB n=1 Tax=Macrococcus armenti TaxID=2875764 RepID=UPI001CCEA52D|nr:16S rRNA (cytosine(967)-C(5))-methyltransferase RsmB [Macrococcus armenti]UBH13997.1 16S rRNA (cytosine(967)-C(5))-methyltransferase RsmB [Macrococcus armenti]
MKHNVRSVALEILDAVLTEGAYSNLLINEAIKKGYVEPVDRALLTELVYGTLQRKLTLEFYAAPYIKTNIKGWMRRLVLMSIYQHVYLDKVPDHAIINEAVEITKRRGSIGGANTVNAILRNFQRNPLRDLNEIKDDLKRLSVTTSTPLWLIKHWNTHFGFDTTRDMAEEFLNYPDTTVRVNTTKITPEDAITRLIEAGYTVEQSEIIPECLTIDGPPIVQHELFKHGFLSVQDASSMLVANVLDPQPGETILDTCSAPGGKACHIAEKMNRTGHIDSHDVHPHKIDLIQYNITRLSLRNIHPSVHDATIPFDKQYDRVLVDAPCSGFGVMKRKPEIKYEKSQKDIDTLWPLQLEILKNAANAVKPGGVLVYSTCTIEQMENENVVYSFIKQNDEFEIEPIHLPVIGEKKLLQVLPQDFNSDGFFIAKLRRKCK